MPVLLIIVLYINCTILEQRMSAAQRKTAVSLLPSTTSLAHFTLLNSIQNAPRERSIRLVSSPLLSFPLLYVSPHERREGNCGISCNTIVMYLFRFLGSNFRPLNFWPGETRKKCLHMHTTNYRLKFCIVCVCIGQIAYNRAFRPCHLLIVHSMPLALILLILLILLIPRGNQ